MTFLYKQMHIWCPSLIPHWPTWEQHQWNLCCILWWGVYMWPDGLEEIPTPCQLVSSGLYQVGLRTLKGIRLGKGDRIQAWIHATEIHPWTISAPSLSALIISKLLRTCRCHHFTCSSKTCMSCWHTHGPLAICTGSPVMHNSDMPFGISTRLTTADHEISHHKSKIGLGWQSCNSISGKYIRIAQHNILK